MSMMNKNSPKSLVKLNEVHKANIEKRLAHRLEAARSKGNQDLVKALESERQLLE
ncbi:MAG: hypothetical protein F6K25_27325 [Okeania sp. SIO2G4]|uniref:arginine synthesis PII-interacting regulator PirA n=1 Tax=unclassified Okeania TaxID=2634635 RepID=UPI0013BCEA86|nr:MULTISPECIES: hypothetical protein [unclassified Okeania]NEP08602.1 hypothetical protein [Okeania sp. SIO4D6]NEP75086.1 hypothetical protein [Okeania sp. SIO2G5]NEP96148.1 hypothetical protein [Okeania sp. SIO2F5]NEQ94162.1 hypothetical protein [Okeania sp. SIO2G4]